MCRLLTVAALVAVASACGGRAVIDRAGSGGGATDGGGSGGGGSVCESAGVRLCGGANSTCPELPPPACPGFGCTPALDRDDFSPGPAGACWADVAGAASLQCTACRDGEVCAQRYDDQLVCVPEAMRAAIFALGATTVCRYADKAHYDATALPSGGGACPGSWLCGGACGECASADTRCTGRSPLHPVGLCAPIPTGLPQELEVAPCALDADGDVLVDCSASMYVDALCAVYDVPPEDQAAARRWGMCISDGVCIAIAQNIPGGLRCYDQYGQQVAPCPAAAGTACRSPRVSRPRPTCPGV